MSYPTVQLSEVARFANGGTPSRRRPEFYEGSIPWITGADIVASGATVTAARSHITEEAVQRSATCVVDPGTVLLVTRTSVGKVGIAGVPLAINQDITAVKPDPASLDRDYLVRTLQRTAQHFENRAQGATIQGVNREVVATAEIPLPPIQDQRRIAVTLDAADTLRAKRREALDKLDTLTQAIFIDMFGDPAANPHRWPTRALRTVSVKFSDGPFGSNLKSAHYQDSGIRVVRLQNIGPGKFVDEVAAYISEDHFASLSKHECRPGDVLVATLGDPNLRACIQPDWLTVALNKADCVQIRVDDGVATSEWLCALLNHPSTEEMAQGLVRGQTRTRISMGRLRDLEVPVPPVGLQLQFSRLQQGIAQQLRLLQTSQHQLEDLFGSLQQRAFRGQL